MIFRHRGIYTSTTPTDWLNIIPSDSSTFPVPRPIKQGPSNLMMQEVASAAPMAFGAVVLNNNPNNNYILENSLCETPIVDKAGSKNLPRRKLSVYQRSFDVDSLHPNQNSNPSEKKRSQSTPDVQMALQSLLNYRCSNSSFHDDSNASDETSNGDLGSNSFEKVQEQRQTTPVIIVQPKFQLPTQSNSNAESRFTIRNMYNIVKIMYYQILQNLTGFINFGSQICLYN